MVDELTQESFQTGKAIDTINSHDNLRILKRGILIIRYF